MHDLCVLLSSNDFVPNPNSGKAGPDPKTLRCHQKCKNDKGSTFPQNVCIADKPGTRKSFFLEWIFLFHNCLEIESTNDVTF